MRIHRRRRPAPQEDARDDAPAATAKTVPITNAAW